MSYTYNEPMKSTSILSGWSGSSTAVYVQLSRQSGASDGLDGVHDIEPAPGQQ